VAAALLSGVVWSTERVAVFGFTLLAWHTVLGGALAAIVLVHLLLRAKRPRRRDVTDRRQALVLGATTAAAVGAYLGQDPVTRALGLGGWSRRFTGSYERASFTGNAFPVTSWVADDPDLLDPAAWRLRVDGLVARPLSLTHARLDRTGDELIALLDCTGGFHSTQRWWGTRLDRVLAAARPTPDASHVRVSSVTGYRWWFELADARELLLATRVGGEPLSHGHGAPLRLVAPDRRGFQWVKWIVAVELLDGPDLGAPAATLTSSL
jgi:DMSO/TMAO reductase YedYZ molybdopterin-dependent catalytic subunit